MEMRYELIQNIHSVFLYDRKRSLFGAKKLQSVNNYHYTAVTKPLTNVTIFCSTLNENLVLMFQKNDEKLELMAEIYMRESQ